MAEAGRETGLWVPPFAQARFDLPLVALTDKQNGVFRVDQAAELGLTASGIRKRAAAGRMHRIYHAVYALVPRDQLLPEGRFMAAVLACGPGAVLSHRSAAVLLALRGSARALIDVTVPGRSRPVHAGIDVHRSTTLTPADVTHVKGIPCTNVARTLLDLAGVINRRGVERACDEAENLDLFDLGALEDQLVRGPTRRAARVLRSVLEEHYAGSTVTWSVLEERFLALVRAAELPQPEVNVHIVLDDGGPPIRGDFVWRAQRVVLETDSRRFHGTRQAFERDRRNDLRLHAADWRPLRTTWQRLDREPELVLGTVIKLLHNRR